MITEERVMSLLANANPSPDDEPSTSIDAVTYLATLEQRSSAMTQQKNDEKAQRNGSLGTTGPDQSSTTLTIPIDGGRHRSHPRGGGRSGGFHTDTGR